MENKKYLTKENVQNLSELAECFDCLGRLLHADIAVVESIRRGDEESYRVFLENVKNRSESTALAHKMLLEELSKMPFGSEYL